MSHTVLVRGLSDELRQQLGTDATLQHLSSLSDKICFIIAYYFDNETREYAKTEAHASEQIMCEILERNTTILEKILERLEEG